MRMLACTTLTEMLNFSHKCTVIACKQMRANVRICRRIRLARLYVHVCARKCVHLCKRCVPTQCVHVRAHVRAIFCSCTMRLRTSVCVRKCAICARKMCICVNCCARATSARAFAFARVCAQQCAQMCICVPCAIVCMWVCAANVHANSMRAMPRVCVQARVRT